MPEDGAIICPHCLSRGGESVMSCTWCDQPLGWIRQSDDARQALAPDESRPGWVWHMEARASWAGGAVDASCPAPGRLELHPPSGEPIRLEQPALDAPLVIRHGTRVERGPMPVRGQRFGEVRLEARLVARGCGSHPVPHIEQFRPDSVSLSATAFVRFGKVVDPGDVRLLNASIEPTHCLVGRSPDGSGHVIIDNATTSGTFVNGRRVLACRLAGGDLVQVGPWAWIFSEEDEFLVPVRAIAGIDVELRGLEMGRGRDPLDLSIGRGQFVAVCGPSGSGKSTLLKAMLGAPGSRRSGRILADGRDITQHRDWYRSVVGYFSQQAVVHEELSAQQAARFSDRFRLNTRAPLAPVLHQVDLPAHAWDRPLRTLSGGERNRARMAVELIALPRLLLLDEPTSGLDSQRELRLLTLLRSLSYRGCTVILVTHGMARLEQFDRVIELDGHGRIVADGPAGDAARDADATDVAPASASGSAETPPEASPADDERPPARTFSQQLLTAAWREALLTINDWPRRLLLPVVIVPLAFAMALHWAVPGHDRTLLGFLMVLAAIWIGASLSLMAIVNERTILEHEHLLFLRLRAYLGAKLAILWSLSTLQSLVFVSALATMRTFSWEEPAHMLFGVAWTFLTLALVGWAAVGLGLLISALARRSKSAANFILPLVMIIQIVFSVHVAGRGQAPLHEAYGSFHLHACRGAEGCQRRVEQWMPPAMNGWLCRACRNAWPQTTQASADPEVNLPETSELRRLISEHRVVDAVADARHNATLPNQVGVALSYLTLSRYGDIVLRSFAYWQGDYEAFRGQEASPRSRVHRFGYADWRRHAVGVLGLLTLALPLATLLILWWQGRSHLISR